MKQRRAFTLIELLVTLTVLVIVSSFIVPNFFSSLRKGQDESAISRASVLDVAKANYRHDKGMAAETLWNSAADDEARYTLLLPYLVSPPSALGNGTEKTGTYTPFGYELDMRTLTNSTTVIRRSDNEQIHP